LFLTVKTKSGTKFRHRAANLPRYVVSDSKDEIRDQIPPSRRKYFAEVATTRTSQMGCLPTAQ
jgi:hypothetical protein